MKTRTHSALSHWSPSAPLPAHARRAFSDLLAYCFPAGTTWRWVDDSSSRIIFRAADDDEVAGITRRLDEAARRAHMLPAPTTRVLIDLWNEPGGQPSYADGDGYDVGPGLQVTGPSLTRLIRAADAFALTAATAAGADEYTVPHLVSWQTIERAGYAKTFPQHLTACAVVGPDLWLLDQFADASDVESRGTALHLAQVTAAPTVCLNLFAALQDRTLDAPVVATAEQSCSRYEAGAGHSATRLWSFAMREIIYVGELAGARRFREAMLDHLGTLIRRLGLPARIEAANDPFFTKDSRDLASYQSGMELKHEVCGRLAGDGTSLAIGSVNLHNQHFGQSFGIRLADGSPVSSACVGFGLDRWARWLHGHLGDDPASWPEPLRAAAGVTGSRC